VAVVHDYLTQRGGAERVVLSLLRAFPGAPLHTSLYAAAETWSEFQDASIVTLPLDRVRLFRTHPRLSMPLLAPSFGHHHVDADVTICSSSGWAHGVQASGAKVVYCHAPARWLYQTDRYLAGSSGAVVAGTRALVPSLRRWDRRAAASATRYLVNSSAVRDLVRRIYGIEAEVVHPPSSLDSDGPRVGLAGIEPGFFLVVGRVLPYKNVEAIAAAFSLLPDERLLVLGDGPRLAAVRALAPANVIMPGAVSDEVLRWAYANAAGLVGASYEDFGLTPVEASRSGLPTAALRFGGYLDTVIEGVTGTMFDEPTPESIAVALGELRSNRWDAHRIREHGERFSEPRFIARLREIVGELAR
jgi:glycosyltransferase involved in cell wall biosynthesis